MYRPNRHQSVSRHPMATALCVLSCGLFLAGCQMGLHHALPEADANEVLGILQNAGLSAHKESDEGSDPPTFSINVASGDTTRAMELLRARGLPRIRRAGLDELYGKPSLIPSASEESARYLGALSAELERTLESLDGVVQSRVHLVLEQRDPLSPDDKPRIPARASVLIKHQKSGVGLAVQDIQRLVAGGVPGLTPDSVTVVQAAAAKDNDLGPQLVALGPLRMTASSRSSAAIGVGVIALLLAIMAGLLIRSGKKTAIPLTGPLDQTSD